jgi:hypothetical protein
MWTLAPWVRRLTTAPEAITACLARPYPLTRSADAATGPSPNATILELQASLAIIWTAEIQTL